MATIYAPDSTIINQGPVIFPSAPPPPTPVQPTQGVAWVPLGWLLFFGAKGQIARKATLRAVDMQGGTIEVLEEATGAVTKVDAKTNRIYIYAPYSTINNYEIYNNNMYNPYVNAPGSTFNVLGRKLDTTLPIIAITNQTN
ncbi:hypothetical protein [Pseudomonas fluorescens]|uniref:hypothetical protein n=1 Tax=Pseudomonas TaxID=286 RepID=UPI002B1DE59F|nr:hypothetical protein [Pseudomonas fluorescens]